MIKHVRIFDKLPLTPLNKISIVQVYGFNKILWIFSIYDLTETWVDENIDKIILKFVRKWRQLPVCANVQHLSFPLSKLDVDFKSVKMLYNQCKLLTSRILRQSKNQEIKLYILTSLIIIAWLTLFLQKIKTKLYLISSLILESTVNLTKVYLIIPWTDLWNLNEQQLLLCHILKVCPVKLSSMWQTLTKRLPSNIFNFCRKTLILCLPNRSNLYRWKITEYNQCFLCHHMQTQLHVFSNCEKCLNRYTWRHDSVVNSLLQQFSKVFKISSKIYCDSNKF